MSRLWRSVARAKAELSVLGRLWRAGRIAVERLRFVYDRGLCRTAIRWLRAHLPARRCKGWPAHIRIVSRYRDLSTQCGLVYRPTRARGCAAGSCSGRAGCTSWVGSPASSRSFSSCQIADDVRDRVIRFWKGDGPASPIPLRIPAQRLLS